MGSSGAPFGVAAAPGWSRSFPLLAGDEGTAQTIRLIRHAVWSGLQDARVREQLAAILQGVPEYDQTAEAKAIYNWVRRNIRFTSDPVGHETVSTAHWTLTYRIGDCDDINAVLIPTLLMAAGIPARLVTVSNDPSDPGRFSHVYAEAQLSHWVPLDAARPGARFGTTVSRYGRKRVWSLVDDSFQDIGRGLSGVAAARGMGGWADDLAKAAGAIASSASQVISSIRVPAFPTTATVPYSQQQQTTGSGSPGISPWVLALGAGALVLLSRK